MAAVIISFLIRAVLEEGGPFFSPFSATQDPPSDPYAGFLREIARNLMAGCGLGRYNSPVQFTKWENQISWGC